MVLLLLAMISDYTNKKCPRGHLLQRYFVNILSKDRDKQGKKKQQHHGVQWLEKLAIWRHHINQASLIHDALLVIDVLFRYIKNERFRFGPKIRDVNNNNMTRKFSIDLLQPQIFQYT